MFHLIKDMYYVLCMRSKIVNIVSRCTSCLAYNPRPMSGEKQSIAMPFGPYLMAAIDNVGL